MEKGKAHEKPDGLQPSQIPKRKRTDLSLFDLQLNQGMDLSIKESTSAANDVEMKHQEDNSPPRKKIFSGLPTSGRSSFQGYSGASSIPSVISPPPITTRPSRSTEYCSFNNFSSTAMWQYMNLPHTVTSKTNLIFAQEQGGQIRSPSKAKSPHMPPLRHARPKSPSNTMPPPEPMDWHPSDSSARTSNSQYSPKKRKKRVSWCDQLQSSGATKDGGSDLMSMSRENQSPQHVLEQAGPSKPPVQIPFEKHSQ